MTGVSKTVREYPEPQIATADIADDAVTFAKMQEISAGVVIGRRSGSAGNPEEIGFLSSELAVSGTTIRHVNNGITNALLRDSAALSVIGRSANSTGDPADIAATPASGQVFRESGSTVGWGQVATAGIANDAVTYAKIQNVSNTDRLLGRDTAGAGDVEELTASGGIEFTGGPGIRTSAFTGDVTKAAGGTALTIANDAVTDAKLRNSGALSVIGRAANSTGDPADISATAASGAVLRESGSTIGFGTVGADGIASGAVTLVKLATQSKPLQYANTSVPGGNTVASTVTETAFSSSYTIPANDLAAGDVIRVRARGVYGTAALAPTLALKLKFGTTIMLDTTALWAALTGALTNVGWEFIADIHVFTIGAAGTLDAQGVATLSTGAGTVNVAMTANTATTTIDTTATQAITITAQWGTSSASNTITLRQLSVEVMRI